MIELMQIVCRHEKKWGLFIDFAFSDDASYEDELDQVKGTAPWFFELKRNEILYWNDGGTVVLFNSEAELNIAFDNTVGDDGPTITNKYSGPGSAYALTCGPDGGLINENT